MMGDDVKKSGVIFRIVCVVGALFSIGVLPVWITFLLVLWSLTFTFPLEGLLMAAYLDRAYGSQTYVDHLFLWIAVVVIALSYVIKKHIRQ